MNKESITAILKKYKKEIISGTIVTTVGVTCYLLGKSHANIIKLSDNSIIHLPTPKRHVGDWEDFWINSCDGHPMAIIRDVHAQFLGDLGAEVFDHCLDCGIVQSYDTPVNLVLELVTSE